MREYSLFDFDVFAHSVGVEMSGQTHGLEALDMEFWHMCETGISRQYEDR